MTSTSPDLSERALEDMLRELTTQNRKEPLSVRPTKLYIRPDVLHQLAVERGIADDAMLEIIIRIVKGVDK